MAETQIPSISEPQSKAIDCLVIPLMLLLSSVNIGVMLSRLANDSLLVELSAPTYSWQEILVKWVLVLWALAALTATVFVFQSRKWGGVIWLLGLPPTWYSLGSLLFSIDEGPNP